MGGIERQPELTALLEEWSATDGALVTRRPFRRVLGADGHWRNARRRVLVRRAIGLLDFDRAALALGLSHDELCGYAFGTRIAPGDVRRLCARLDRGDEQLVAGAVAAELGAGSALLRNLIARFGWPRARVTPTRAESANPGDRGAA